MIQNKKREILGLNDPAQRLDALFDLAAKVYDDPELATGFTQEQHRGHTGMAPGAPDMHTFVDVTEMVKTEEGACRAVGFLQREIITSRLRRDYKAGAKEIDYFFSCQIPSIGISPTQALQELDYGYELVEGHLDLLDAGGFA